MEGISAHALGHSENMEGISAHALGHSQNTEGISAHASGHSENTEGISAHASGHSQNWEQKSPHASASVKERKWRFLSTFAVGQKAPLGQSGAPGLSPVPARPRVRPARSGPGAIFLGKRPPAR
jgi:hypothetical protein